MNKKKLNENIIIIFVICINIFLSLPFLLYTTYKNKKINIYLWGLFFFIFGFFFISSNPEIDINRHYEVINNLKNTSNINEVIFLKHQRDLFLPLIMLFIVKINLTNMFVAGTVEFISHYFLFKSFNLVVKNIKLSKKQFFIYFIVLLMNIPIIGFTGLRFLPAISIFVYGVIGYYKKKENKYFIAIFTAPLIHFGMWLMTALFVISLFFPKMIMKKINIYGIIIFIISNFNLNILILKTIEYINNIKPLFNPGTYILNAKYGSKFGLHSNVLGIISSKLLLFLPLAIFLIILLYIKNYKKYSFVYLGIVMMFLLQNNNEPFNRYSTCLLFIVYLLNVSNKFFTKNFNNYNSIYFLFFLCGIIRLIRDFRSYWSLLYECYVVNIFQISLINLIIKNIIDL